MTKRRRYQDSDGEEGNRRRRWKKKVWKKRVQKGDEEMEETGREEVPQRPRCIYGA